MSDRNSLILHVHLAGAGPYQLGDEIWQQSLHDAIDAEAEIIADHAGPELLPMPSSAARVALRDRIVAEMTAALHQIGDTYTAPDRVAYTLTDQAQLDLPARRDTLATMSPSPAAPVVEEVLRFEDLPVGAFATRAAIVRWSDGTESQALAWYADEILICEGDHGPVAPAPAAAPRSRLRCIARRSIVVVVTEQALLILASLTTGELHGYGIANDVEALSSGRVKLAAGTLYGVLNRLSADGLITQTREEVVGGRRRRYYQLTGPGHAALAQEAAGLRSTAAAVSARVAAGPNPSPKLA